MKFEDALIEYAVRKSDDLRAKYLAIREEMQNAERLVHELNLKAVQTNAAIQDLLNYSPKKGEDFVCPSCWSKDSGGAILQPRSSPNAQDLFMCRGCGHEFVTPEE